jgi:bacteriorhodopsin
MLLLGTGVPLSELFMTIFASIFMVVSALVGALIPSTYKWGFFTFAVLAGLFIAYHVIFPSTAATDFLGSGIASGFRRHSIVLMFIWMLYPICWGLSEGGNVISPTGEMIFYGILDLITRPLFLFAYVRQVGTVDYGVWGFQSGKVSQFSGGRNTNAEKERMRAEDAANNV